MLYSLISMGASLASDGASGTGAQGGGSSSLMSFLPILLMVVVFYFLLIRPQRKREKETKNMLAAIKKGDKVVTIGGIRGTIVAVKEGTVLLKVDDNTKIEFNKSAISQVLNQSAAPAEPAKKAKKEDLVVEAPAKEKKAEEISEKTEEKAGEAPAEEAEEKDSLKED